jgi:hypothetical protein
MIAGDVPNGHRDPTAMARVLASYMKDARAIRREVLAHFGGAPSVRTIDRMRAEHLRSLERPQEAPWKPYEGYRPQEQAERLEEANTAFLRALRAERDISLRPKLTWSDVA